MVWNTEYVEGGLSGRQRTLTPTERHALVGSTDCMPRVDLRRVILLAVPFLLLPALTLAELNDDIANDSGQPGNAAAIIAKYLQVTQGHQDGLRGASMQVDIDASIVKLKEHGRLRALRKISKVGQITYRVLGFQGDNTVKNDVIARYLQAEQQAQEDRSLAITPANYKFKFKGRKDVDSGTKAYVFQLSPRAKKVGLFKGEIWLDERTCLPVVEKGKLVKNPSIWFKKVEFERDFAIQDGVAIPKSMSSKIDVRLVGTVDLKIDYSNFEQNAESEDGGHAQSVALSGSAAK